MATSDLIKQRKLTRAVAELLSRELNTYLKSVTALINPRSIFEEHIHGGRNVTTDSGTKAFQQLQSAYQKLHARKPFDLPATFAAPITLLSTTPKIRPVEYNYRATGTDGDKQVIVAAPLRWVLTYEGFDHERLRKLLNNSADENAKPLQETVLHSLLLAITLEAKPGIAGLFEALRFPITIEHHDEFGELPIVVISSPIKTTLPNDNIVIESTEISGSNRFEEIADGDLLDNIADPLKEKLQSLIATHSPI